MELAAALFQYAGEHGDTNALYTYAQLLRTGISTVSVISVSEYPLLRSRYRNGSVSSCTAVF